MPRGCRIERLALTLFGLDVLGGGVGIAGEQLQIGQQLAADFRIEAFRPHRTCRADSAEFVIERLVLLLDTEDREAGVDPAIEQLTLQAQLIVAADNRFDGLIVRGQVSLRLKDIRIAHIRRPLLVQGIYQAGVRRHHTALPDLGRTGHAGQHAGGIEGRGVIADATTEHGGQRFGELVAHHAIEAVLADATVGVGRIRQVQQRGIAGPRRRNRIVDVRHEAGEGVVACHQVVIFQVVGVGADDHFMLAPEGPPFAGEVDVDGLVGILEVVQVGPRVEAVAG